MPKRKNEDPSGDKPAKVARGARGPNNLDSEPEFYAFVSQVEGLADGSWIVDVGTVTSVWMDNIWAYLRKTSVGPRYAGLLDGKAIADVFPSLAPDDKRMFFLVYLWFVKAVLDEEEELFGRAPTGMFRFVLLPGDALRDQIEECLWFHLDLEDVGEDDEAPYQGPFVELGSSYKLDTTTLRKLLPASFEKVGLASYKNKITQSGLHALHLPQVDPLGMDEPDEPGAPDDGPGRGPSGGGKGGDRPSWPLPVPMDEPPWPAIDVPIRQPIPVFARLRGTIRAIGREVESLWDRGAAGLRALGDTLAFPGLEPALAGAGGAGVIGRHWPDRRPLVDPVVRYIGSPATNTGNAGNNPWFGVPVGPANQAANPMIQAGATQPFVGVLDVGQGCCNFLCDTNDHVFTYFDFGYPTGLHGGGGPAAEPNPCFCHRPLIILSHWDYDHWGLCRRNLDAYRLQWLAPQQHMATYEIAECIARILMNGGQLNLWTGDGGGAGTHMTFPWGYLERESGPNPLNAGRRNTTGLVAYVCVRDQKGTDAGLAAAAPVDNSLAAPNVPQVGGGGAAAGCTVVAVGAPPAYWPAGLVWATHQTNATNNRNGRIRGRAAAVLVPLGVNQARIREIAAVAAVCARVEDLHLGGGQPPSQACADIGLGVVDACTALILGGALLTPVAITGQLAVMGGAYPGYAAAAGSATPYALEAGIQSAGAVAAAQTQLQRIGRICTHMATRLVAQAGGEVAVLGYLGLADPGGNAAAKRRAIASGLAALVRYALHPGPAVLHANGIPKVQPGAAPFCANERFVLLTGDADFGLMPSQHQAPPPVVVGLLAAHHGSKQMDNRQLTAAQIPWAQRSVEADAARAARVSQVAGNNIDVIARDAGDGLQNPAPGVMAQAAALAQATLWGTAAEELLQAMNGLIRGALVATVGGAQGAGAAAAAAVAAREACLVLGHGVGIQNVAVVTAGALAFTHCEEVHPHSVGIAAAFAAAASEAFITAAVVPHFLKNNAHLQGENAVTAQVALGSYWATPNVDALAYSLGSVAVHASHSANVNFQPYLYVAGFAQGNAAAGGVAGAPVPLGPFLEEMRVRIMGVAGVAALVGLGAVGAPAAAAPPGAMTWRRWAATYGAEGGVADSYQVDAAKLRSALEASFANTAPLAPPGGGGAGIIAYSYGLAGIFHSHRAQPGDKGHPHPFSIQKYMAKGWTERRNTPDTRASMQPDPSPWGAIAMGWEDNTLVAVPMVAYEGPLRTAGPDANGHASIPWTCPTCPAPQIISLIV